LEKEKVRRAENQVEKGRLYVIHQLKKYDKKVDKEGDTDLAETFDQIRREVQLSNCSIATINVNSLLSKEKFDKFQRWVIVIGRPTVVVAVEVWRPNPSYNHLDGYHLPLSHCRVGRLGGGISVYIKKDLAMVVDNASVDRSHYNDNLKDQVEAMSFDITTKAEKKTFRLVSVYQPPQTTVPSTLTSLHDIFTTNFNRGHPTLLVGDINIDVLSRVSPCVTKYKQLLKTHNLHQYVEGPTREKTTYEGTTSTLIDHIVAKNRQSLTCHVIPAPFSDHHGTLVSAGNR
jgi:hypothetical protein